MAWSLRTLLVPAILLAGIAYTSPTPDPVAMTPGTVSPGDVDPVFRITAWRGSLTVAGHTRSQQHEARLRELAERYFPGHEKTFEFRPLGLVPDWWTAVTEELLATMAPTESPAARLAGDTLEIDAIVPAGVAAESRIRSLASLLPSTMRLQSRLVPSGPALSERELCERLFRAFRAGPVNFSGTGTALRPSAYPELDRIVMLADSCRGATLTITGHTDATGSETWNRELSLDRARVVAAYLAGRGIDADHIGIVGAGSAAPVANNATRYGRSLNRRIDFSFSYDPVYSGDVRLTSSISNNSVALGGTGGLPRSP